MLNTTLYVHLLDDHIPEEKEEYQIILYNIRTEGRAELYWYFFKIPFKNKIFSYLLIHFGGVGLNKLQLVQSMKVQ